jgi:hypothetical protein
MLLSGLFGALAGLSILTGLSRATLWSLAFLLSIDLVAWGDCPLPGCLRLPTADRPDDRERRNWQRQRGRVEHALLYRETAPDRLRPRSSA